MAEGGFDAGIALRHSLMDQARLPLSRDWKDFVKRESEKLVGVVNSGDLFNTRPTYTPLEGSAGVLPSAAKKLVVSSGLEGRTPPPVRISYEEDARQVKKPIQVHLIHTLSTADALRNSSLNQLVASVVVVRELQKLRPDLNFQAIVHSAIQDPDGRVSYRQSLPATDNETLEKLREHMANMLADSLIRRSGDPIDNLDIFFEFGVVPQIQQYMKEHPEAYHLIFGINRDLTPKK